MVTEKSPEIRQKEFEALTILRKQFRMRDAGANKWDALCPAHNDHNRSLRVYRVNDRLYFRCYAGCSFNDVRRALGLPIVSDGRNRPRIYRSLRKMEYVGEVAAPTRADEIIDAYDYEILTDTFIEDAAGMQPLADMLGLPVEALLDAECGRAEEFPMFVRHLDNGEGKEIPISAWTWPMKDGKGEITGIRLRFDNGDKRSFTGSVPGLFLGNRWGMPGPLMIVEGPTDRAAACAWGYDAAGLPSCNDGYDLIDEFLATIGRGRDVVLLAQVDEAKTRPRTGEIFYPGQDGMTALAERIFRRVSGSMRLITPSNGYDDARKWYCGGGRRRDVDRMIEGKKQWRPGCRRKGDA